jgi:protein dithiol oxidoreductase (disulfide-forming)
VTRKGGILAVVLLIASIPVHADVVAGRDYSVLPVAQRGDTAGKIEVIEFFSYGCPACYKLHAHIMKWAETLPSDVVFRRIAVGFGRPAWISLGRAFYAFEATGVLGKVDDAIFDAVHARGLPLRDRGSIAQWMKSQGVPVDDFIAAFESFGVSARMSRSEQMVIRYRVDGVPRVVVDGRFVVHDRAPEELLSIAEALIAKARTAPAAR